MNTIIVPYEEIMEAHEVHTSGFIFDKFVLRLIQDKKAHDVLIQIDDSKSWFTGNIWAAPVFGKKEDAFLLELVYQINVSPETGEPIVHMAPLDKDMTQEDCKRYVEAGYGYGEWVLRALLTIMEEIENRNKVIKESTGGRTTTKRSKNVKKTEDNKVFLLDDLVEYVVKNNIYPKHSAHHSIQCPCWSVRGHYRTYKSGKTVFVKPHRKGKKRETAEPKENIYIV
ncbi:hypothetical protein [Blautia sp. MSJ-19]|uniref:hypothetical protein n=1 Tax=Blautia sp. MSJ-19 TaxID=2841517 RepID=UPI001C0F2859|nr:hypothetical protein [Blautia sp. MSJ-19]MBU5480913.1 hypothetical protein [Blautia sp. MSJ-19]